MVTKGRRQVVGRVTVEQTYVDRRFTSPLHVCRHLAHLHPRTLSRKTRHCALTSSLTPASKPLLLPSPTSILIRRFSAVGRGFAGAVSETLLGCLHAPRLPRVQVLNHVRPRRLLHRLRREIKCSEDYDQSRCM